MTREIKFRAWDIEDNRMHYERNIEELGKEEFDPSFIFHYRQYQPFNSRFVLMQFTGLKDKNGKEIYEGDIVRRNNHAYGTPDWTEKAYELVWGEKKARFELEGDNTWGLIWEMEVIGNIYENPDLLPHPDYGRDCQECGGWQYNHRAGCAAVE
jgi:uncharacterized phage protein (TIGR01671 family)